LHARARRFAAACMVKKGGEASSGPKKRKLEKEQEVEVDWDALLGEELEEGGVDLDEMGRVMVRNSKIK
jgi:hypothetical protein